MEATEMENRTVIVLSCMPDGLQSRYILFSHFGELRCSVGVIEKFSPCVTFPAWAPAGRLLGGHVQYIPPLYSP